MASSSQGASTLRFSEHARHPSGAGLYLFDIDDTIKAAGAKVSDRVLAAIRAADAAGITCAIASGRPLCMIEDDLIGSGVFSHVICANGAQVWSLEEDRRLLHRPMSCEDALACHDMLASLRPAWNAFMDGRACFEWGGVSYLLRKRGDRDSSLGQPTGKAHGFLRRALRFARRGVRFLRRLVRDADNRQVLRIRPYLAKAEDGVSKMGCSFADEPSASRAQSLLEADGRYEVARVSRTELEITAKGVTKASGARFLADALGIRRERCVAFGNGANDLPMVEVVGRFVAVANADAVVREAATEVCPNVTADGVAIWIESELARTIT